MVSPAPTSAAAVDSRDGAAAERGGRLPGLLAVGDGAGVGGGRVLGVAATADEDRGRGDEHGRPTEVRRMRMRMMRLGVVVRGHVVWLRVVRLRVVLQVHGRSSVRRRVVHGHGRRSGGHGCHGATGMVMRHGGG